MSGLSVGGIRLGGGGLVRLVDVFMRAEVRFALIGKLMEICQEHVLSAHHCNGNMRRTARHRSAVVDRIFQMCEAISPFLHR